MLPATPAQLLQILKQIAIMVKGPRYFFIVPLSAFILSTAMPSPIVVTGSRVRDCLDSFCLSIESVQRISVPGINGYDNGKARTYFAYPPKQQLG